MIKYGNTQLYHYSWDRSWAENILWIQYWRTDTNDNLLSFKHEQLYSLRRILFSQIKMTTLESGRIGYHWKKSVFLYFVTIAKKIVVKIIPPWQHNFTILNADIRVVLLLHMNTITPEKQQFIPKQEEQFNCRFHGAKTRDLYCSAEGEKDGLDPWISSCLPKDAY